MELVQADFSFAVFFGLAIFIAGVAAEYYFSMYRQELANSRLDGLSVLKIAEEHRKCE